jgi:hypothetical protein
MTKDTGGVHEELSYDWALGRDIHAYRLRTALFAWTREQSKKLRIVKTSVLGGRLSSLHGSKLVTLA